MWYLAKLLKALNSDASPWQIAFGIALGMVMGLTPFMRLHNLIILFVVLFFRVNIGAALLAYMAFGLLAFALDPLMASIGEGLLTSPAWQATWTALYSTSFGQLSQFFHTLTLGSFVLAMLLFVPVLLLSKWIVEQYREHIMAWVNKWKLVQFLKSTKLFALYQKIGD